MTDVDRAVWAAVRRGDRKGTVLTPGVVFARTGIRVTDAELHQAAEALLADGRLYWRGSRIRRRVLASRWPDPPPEPEAPLAGWDRLGEDEGVAP